ncbi:MAG: pyridoxal phosphate-dependent aminotransferase family protein [Solirubrobacteraceae bacterium]|jgi:8-amino-7-oxononanoate synthase
MARLEVARVVRSLRARRQGNGSGASAPRRDEHWLARWMRTTADLADLQYSHRMVDAVIDEIDGRQIRIGDHWLADFASCNYLGLDLDPELIAAIPEYLEQWGTHPSWSRLLGSPVLYEQLEARLTELLGSEDCLLLPTVSLIHLSVLPVLAGSGTLFLDGRAHKTIYDGCSLSVARGATVARFAHNDLDQLESLLRGKWQRPGVICIDGINSMTGNAPDLRTVAALAREHDALLYVDDAHGFGVVGERCTHESCSYGARGNSVVRHLGESYENTILVGGMSKAYSSLLAFVACPTAIKQVLKTAAPPYLYSGPSPVASLATASEGLRINEQRGEQLRERLFGLTASVLARLDELGVATPNRSGFPIIEIPLAQAADVGEAGDFLFDEGIYVTMAAYPLVPRDEVGFRVQLTAANTDAQVEHLNSVLGELAQRFALLPSPAARELVDHA